MNNQTAKIPLDLIDDPRLAMRSETDEPELEELIRSMRELGLIQPVVLRKIGERYEIIAGHRRTRAARLLDWATIPAHIVEADDHKTLAMRLAENIQRHDVDPVDEACFIGEAIKMYKLSEADLAETLHRSRQWVEERLEVFSMPDYLQTALKHKRFPLGAALWLNRIENEGTRRQYTTWASSNGVSVAGAKQWYENLKATNFTMQTTDIQVQDDGALVQRVRKVVVCAACKQNLFLDEADSVWVHRTCPTSVTTLEQSSPTMSAAVSS